MGELKIIKTKPVQCDKCGRNMTTKKDTSHIGAQFTVDKSVTKDFKELYPELKVPCQYSICWVCWLEVLGVKLKK